ncbi:potassium:proton antiporter [Aureococcus anophagefferens]|nr:potassium:proton antiporter [Aureococcus anophagefferens]
MTSFASQRSSKGSFSFRSLRTRPKRASSTSAGDDDEPSDADYPYVWALRKTSVLDWEKDVPDADARRAEVSACSLPVDVVPGEVYLGDAVCARDVARLQSLHITHVPPRARRARRARGAGIERSCSRRATSRVPDARQPPRRRAGLPGEGEARRRRGPRALRPGPERSGVLVAADLMLEERRSVLDAVRHCRARRGNECVSNKTFQRDLVDLAARTCSGRRPARGGAVAQEAPPRPAAPAAAAAPAAPSRRRSTSLWGGSCAPRRAPANHGTMAMERFGMFTFVVILVLGVLSRQYLGRALRLPYTVILMVLGALTGLLIENRRNAFELNLKSWYDMTPQVILYCFVPILVFESAFMTDTHIFSRQKWQILTLAGPRRARRVDPHGRLRQGRLHGLRLGLAHGAHVRRHDERDGPRRRRRAAQGARRLRAPGHAHRGRESLLNDGTAIVVFDVFKHALEHKPCDAEMPSWQSVLRMLFRLGALGPVVGTAIGWCAATLLGYVLNDPLNEITITLITCYAAFAVAEGIVGTSGVLSVVFAGMYLSRYGRGRISADVEENLHSFWGVLAHVANTAVFFLSGLIMSVKVFGIKRSGSVVGECFKCGDDDDHAADHHRFLYGADARRALSGGYSADVETDCTTFRNRDVYYLLVLYVALHAIRGLVLVLSTPVLRSGIYGMSLNQGLVVAYGGLRGAIGLALALIVNETKGLPDQLQMRMLFHVSGIAILTLCVNGTTMVHVLNWTGLSKKTDAEDEIFAHVTVDVDKKLANEIASLTREQYLGDADWKMIWRYLPVFSVETYWLRLRDGHIVLSGGREDLASWSEAPRDVGVVQRLWRVLFPRDRRADYRIPPLLHRRWVNYHR